MDSQINQPIISKHKRVISKQEEGSYFEIPFTVPEGIARLDIRYNYTRYRNKLAEDGHTDSEEVNIVDLALRAPQGFLGASGSDRDHIWISAENSSAGYAISPVMAGTWYIIAGAYKIEDNGVEVTYDTVFTPKTTQLLRGDMHAHTTASDGNLTAIQLMEEALRLGLDFVCLTDHNAFTQNDAIAVAPQGLTVIPGMEFTHFKGHCGLLGVCRPIDNPFCVNTWDEMENRLNEAKGRGAFIAINHPFSAQPWEWGLERTTFDLLEIWNGGTSPVDNRECIDWWHKQLVQGKRIAVIGGSDFHSTDTFRSFACPTTWVYAASKDPQDILTALQNGNGFVTMSHKGPRMSVSCGSVGLGGVAIAGMEAEVIFEGLSTGDEVHIINDKTADVFTINRETAQVTLRIPTHELRFLRFEVMYSKLSPFAGLPRLISNAVYFSEKGDIND